MNFKFCTIPAAKISRMSNEKLITALQKLKEQRKAEGQTYRVRAYETAIASLRGSTREIMSGKEATELPGIGKSIADHIDKILSNQAVILEIVTEINPISERQKVIDLFCQLHGVGSVTANAWYEKGYRSLDDLRNSGLDFHYSVKVSLDHFEELSQRIPREKITQFDLDFRDWISRNLNDVRIEICGSYRRLCRDSGDIDVVVCSARADLFEQIKKYPRIQHILGEGPKKMLATISLQGKLSRIDFERVQPDEYAYAILYFTGSKNHNEMMRARAKEKGWRLNEKSMHEISIGIEFEARTEEEIFKLLDLKYIPPESRNI
jgi:DNA polymerase lambda